MIPHLALRPAAIAALLALAPALAVAAGTVTGKVDVKPARFQDETVVYLESGAPRRAPAATHQIDQQGIKFIPFVLAIAVGDTVDFLNHDGVEHDVFSPDHESFHLGRFRVEEQRSYTFRKAGAYSIRCDLHPSMLAWVLVTESGYAAPIDRKGRFRIDDVPPGTYTLAVWNAHVDGPRRTITVVDGKTVEESFTVEPAKP
jgi:plastocyanin